MSVKIGIAEQLSVIHVVKRCIDNVIDIGGRGIPVSQLNIRAIGGPVLKVSQSKINAWRMCRKKYHLKYNENLRRKVKVRPLAFGSIIHALIEAEAEGKSWIRTLEQIDKEQGPMFREEIEALGDVIGDARIIMDEYFRYWKKDPIKFLKHNKRTTEHAFEVEIDDGIVAKGRIDGFVSYRKMEALLENKSHKDFPNEDGRWRNLQTCVYTRFVDMLGWFNLEGVLWNYVRSKSPTRPQLLKSGGLSERKIDTLPSVVVDTIKSHKLNPKDYASLIADAEANVPTYYKRVFTPILKRTVDQVFRDFVDTAREISEVGHKHHTRTIGRHCSWCEFEPICRATLTGADEEYVIEKEYTVEDEEPIELVDSE